LGGNKSRCKYLLPLRGTFLFEPLRVKRRRQAALSCFTPQGVKKESGECNEPKGNRSNNKYLLPLRGTFLFECYALKEDGKALGDPALSCFSLKEDGKAWGNPRAVLFHAARR